MFKPSAAQFGKLGAELLLWKLQLNVPVSHGRVLFRSLPVDQAEELVTALLNPAKTVPVEIQLDAGTSKVFQAAALTFAVGEGRTVVVLPAVVTSSLEAVVATSTLKAATPVWQVTQGFASRLRNDFARGAEAQETRLLVLFDALPVETETSTVDADLSFQVESNATLFDWLSTRADKDFTNPTLKALLSAVLSYWKERLDMNSQWDGLLWSGRLVRGYRLVEHAATAKTTAEFGLVLPELGLLLPDPELEVVQKEELAQRLDQNYKYTTFLEGLRTNRTRDPLLEAEKQFELDDPEDPFVKAVAAALRDTHKPIPESRLSFPKLKDRERVEKAVPVFLDFSSIEASTAEGDELRWEVIEPKAPGEKLRDSPDFDLVVAATTQPIELSFNKDGTARSELFVDGKPMGELKPGGRHRVTLSSSSEFAVHKISVRPNHRSRKDLQVIKVAVESTAKPMVPIDAELDLQSESFKFDGQADSLSFRWQGREVRIDREVVPDDGGEVRPVLDGPLVRVSLEDRAEDEPRAPRSPRVRILEELPLQEGGQVASVTASQTEAGEVELHSGVARRTLDVAPEYFEWETMIVAAPDQFLGIGPDSDAAVKEVTQVAPSEFAEWVQSRKALFSLIGSESRKLLPYSDQHTSVYLVDFRKAEAGEAARQYVNRYIALLEALVPKLAKTAGQTLVQSVLFCDRVEHATGLLVSPTHPLAVGLIATLQRDVLLDDVFADKEMRSASSRLLDLIARSQPIPWLSWGGHILRCVHEGTPFLWRRYVYANSAETDADAELKGVIVSKVRRLLRDVVPSINDELSSVVINVELGGGSSNYLVEALKELVADTKLKCAFDVGVVRRALVPSALERVFSGRTQSQEDQNLRDALRGRVLVSKLSTLFQREDHLTFRMSAGAELSWTASVSSTAELIHGSSFSAGLSVEPVRTAQSGLADVNYFQYVYPKSFPLHTESTSTWGSLWRQGYLRTAELSLVLARGMDGPVSLEMLPARKLRQEIEKHADQTYRQALLTVHCDSAQGPEFFVGTRGQKSAVYLVECSDRGQPELPGRDIVTVTSHLAPFRAALRRALDKLPPKLKELVDDPAAASLLTDINALRASWVFDFIRVANKPEADHVTFLGALDNIIMLRLLLGEHAVALDGSLPIILDLNDVISRVDESLTFPPKGSRCDDLLVVYIPPASHQADLVLNLRLVEAKFGDNTASRKKAVEQLRATAKHFRAAVPRGRWLKERNPKYLLLARDLGWLIHEAIERYRAFEIVGVKDAEFEAKWATASVLDRINAGDFTVRLGGVNPFTGTFDSDLDGSVVLIDGDSEGDHPIPELKENADFAVLPIGLMKKIIGARASFVAKQAGSSASGVRSGGSKGGGSLGDSEPKPPQSGSQLHLHLQSNSTAEEKPSSSTPSLPPLDVALAGEKATIQAPQQSSSARAQDRGTVSRLEPIQAFDGFIGNERAVEILSLQLKYAQQRGISRIDSVGLFGPKSTGKTELARRIASGLGVPPLFLSETSLGTAESLAEKIQKLAAEHGKSMQSLRKEAGTPVYEVPPMLLFIDEVHQLANKVQDSLLTFMEPTERTLRTAKAIIDARNVTFVIATTDPGRLREAFRSRVREITLDPYSVSQVADILEARLQRLSSESALQIDEVARGLERDALLAIATAARAVPRQALALISEISKAISVQSCGTSAEEVWEYLRRLIPCDRSGLTKIDYRYLEIVGKSGPIGKDRIASTMGIDPTTVDGIIEPFLLQQGFIQGSGQGRLLTTTGKVLLAEFLRKRGA